MWHFFGQSNNVVDNAVSVPILPAIPPLATLTEDEMNSILKAKQILEYKALEKALMERGINDIWNCIRKKYNLPEEFDYHSHTGEAHVRTQ